MERSEVSGQARAAYSLSVERLELSAFIGGSLLSMCGEASVPAGSWSRTMQARERPGYGVLGRRLIRLERATATAERVGFRSVLGPVSHLARYERMTWLPFGAPAFIKSLRRVVSSPAWLQSCHHTSSCSRNVL